LSLGKAFCKTENKKAFLTKKPFSERQVLGKRLR
jgi:hypothetical protein